jgi:hypothetical protein
MIPIPTNPTLDDNDEDMMLRQEVESMTKARRRKDNARSVVTIAVRRVTIFDR